MPRATMPPTVFGTAAAFHCASSLAPALMLPHSHQQGKISDDPAGDFENRAPSAVATSAAAAPDRRPSPPALHASICLQLPYAWAEGDYDEASPSSIFSGAQPAALSANVRGPHVRNKSVVTCETPHRRRNSVLSPSMEPTGLENGSPRGVLASDKEFSRRDGSDNSVLEGPLEAGPTSRLGEQQLLVQLPAGSRRAPPPTAITNNEEELEASKQREYGSQHSPESETLAEISLDPHKSPTDLRNRGAATQESGSDRVAPQRGYSGTQKRAPHSQKQHPEETAGQRRKWWGKPFFFAGVENQCSNKYMEEAVEGGCTCSALDDDHNGGTTPHVSSNRRRRRNTTGRHFTKVEARLPLPVKPCIWITPRFDKWTGATLAGNVEAVAPASGAAGEGGRGSTAATWLPAPSKNADTALTFPEAYGDKGCHLKSPEEGTALHRRLKKMLKIATRGGGGDGSTAKASEGVLESSPWRVGGRHKHSSPLRFFAIRVFWLFLYFAVSDVFMSALSTASDMVYQHNPQPKLRDKFHDWVLGGMPPPGLRQTATDILTVSLLIVTLVRHLFFVQLPLNIVIMYRFFFLMATTYWLRGIAIFLTTMPSSVPNCKVRPVYSAGDFVQNVLLASTFALPQCTDMIISGHTLSTCLCVATWLFYNNCNKDQTEVQRAPFYIFLRWVLRHLRKSSVGQHTQVCLFPDDGQVVCQPHQLEQPRPQQPEQRPRKSSNAAARVPSAGNKRSQKRLLSRHGPKRDGEERREHHDATGLSAASMIDQHYGISIEPSCVTGAYCRADVGGEQLGRMDGSDTVPTSVERVLCVMYDKEDVKVPRFFDGGDESQGREDDEATIERAPLGEGHGGSVEAERSEPPAGTPQALLRNDALVAAAAAVSETLVGAAAVASGVFLPVAVRSGGWFPDDRDPGSPVRRQPALFPDKPAYRATATCESPLGDCAGENDSLCAASAALSAMLVAASIVEEDERKSSTHTKEMEDFAAIAGQRIVSADDTDCKLMNVEGGVGEQSETGTRYMNEDCFLINDRKHGGHDLARSSRTDYEYPREHQVFHNPVAFGRERPSYPRDLMRKTGDPRDDLAEAGARGARGEEGGKDPSVMSSAHATNFCSVRLTAAAANEGEKSRYDCSGVSALTAGAGSSSSSEEEDGMRALLAPHKSHRHPAEKDSPVNCNCCRMPGGLSPFLVSAQKNSVGRDPAVEEQAPQSICVPVKEPAASRGEEEATVEGCLVSVDGYHNTFRSKDVEEEELERMGQYCSGDRQAAGCRWTAQGITARGRRIKSNSAQLCSRYLRGIGRRLVALLWWACAWNLLGTYCILQAAANIILIDVSFVHYTVDIFFGVIVSFGCFTLYHMIVCLLWAARTHDSGRATDLQGGQYAVVPSPSSIFHRRRSSCHRNTNSNKKLESAPVHGKGATGEFSRSFPRCKRRAAGGSRLSGTEAAGNTVSGRGSGERMSQETAGVSTWSVERNSSGRGRRGSEAGSDEDLSERTSVNADLPEQEATNLTAGGSGAVALFVMEEIEGGECHDEGKTRAVSSLAKEEGARCTGHGEISVEHAFQQATADTVATTAATASVKAGTKSLATNQVGEYKERECSNRQEKLQQCGFPQPLEGSPHPASGQRQVILNMPVGGDRHLQSPVSRRFCERSAEATDPDLQEDREARLSEQWKCSEETTDSAERQHPSALRTSPREGTGNGRSPAGDVGLFRICCRGRHVARAAAQPGALRKTQNKMRGSENTTEKAVRVSRRHRVLQSMERTLVGESQCDVGPDIAISILRFPLVRCAAFFIARLEGLELP